MGAYDAAKDFAKVAITSGLSIDIIQLLEKKRDLLLDEIATLQKDNATLKSENANLKQEVSDLHQQVSDLSPPSDDIDDTCREILKFLFHRGDDTALEYVAEAVGISSSGTLLYYRDILRGAGLIADCGMVTVGENLGSVTILPKGRQYVVQNRLA